MQPFEIEVRIEKDGEVHLQDLPFRAGQIVRVSIRVELSHAERRELARRLFARKIPPEDIEFWERFGNEVAELRRQGSKDEDLFKDEDLS